LTYFEARACANAGVFRSFAKVRPTHVAVNEHAMNAYDDFCRSVSQAPEIQGLLRDAENGVTRARKNREAMPRRFGIPFPNNNLTRRR
jgi:hypothetical protein